MPKANVLFHLTFIKYLNAIISFYTVPLKKRGSERERGRGEREEERQIDRQTDRQIEWALMSAS